MQHLTIREAEGKDAPLVSQLLRDTWLATYINEELDITAAAINQFYDNMKAKAQEYQARYESEYGTGARWVAEADDKIVGVAVVNIDNNELKAIYVHPNNQGQGVGSILMRKALDVLDGNKNITVNVASYNERAIRFYEKYGFEFLAPKMEDNFTLPNDATIPEISMIKRA